MKTILYTIAIITLIGCNNTTKKENTTIHNPNLEAATEKGVNTMIEDTVDGGKMYLGKINYTGLQRDFSEAWYSENYNNHELDSTLVDSIKELLPTVSVKVFMGTWCEDSQREIPALAKIYETVAQDLDDIELIAVSHDKDTPQGFEQNLNIEYVPTIIFYKNGEELNRIVEYTHGSLEQDMLTILNGAPYKHAYAE